MSLRRLEVNDFRLFRRAQLVPESEGTTVITGSNGSGKTSLLEALAYLGSGRSFRGAPLSALVRVGADRAVVRADLQGPDSPVLMEAEVFPAGRGRTRVNRKPARGRRDLATAAPCTVFSPEDLALVAGGPKGRRDLLDDTLALVDPPGDRAVEEAERILRQRGALLRQAAGRPWAEVAHSLDVWDERLARAGTALAAARERLVEGLSGFVVAGYRRLAGGGAPAGVALSYRRSWTGELGRALAESRHHDVRRAVNTVGPHRDDLFVELDGRDARTHASQGEQRCLALALRLGIHELVRVRTALRPTLLLDDVFSELDPVRSEALVEELPDGQSIVTTASAVPRGIDAARVIGVGELVVA